MGIFMDFKVFNDLAVKFLLCIPLFYVYFIEEDPLLSVNFYSQC